MRVGELCAGYGGIGLGVASAGVDVAVQWVAEVDPALAGFHPVNVGDITRADWSGVEPVDLLTAGFPCQPVSAAGRQRGDDDHRWLWPSVRAAVAALRPGRVLIENVLNLVSIRRGALWRGILDDLTGLGYGVRWLTIGACHVGAAHHRHRVFALAELGRSGVERVEMPPCGSLVELMPTPRSRDVKGAELPGRREARIARGTAHKGYDLPTAVALLPTPAARDGDGRGEGDGTYWSGRIQRRRRAGLPLGAAVALLPTPTASEATGAGAGHATQGGANLRTAVALLPTPGANDANGGRRPKPATVGENGRVVRPSGESYGIPLASAVQLLPERFGRFAAAVERHAALYGPPPAPTEPNRNGAPRLAPAFAEWLMCLPAGHVTAKLARKHALRAIGNGVCPPQAAAAWLILTDPAGWRQPDLWADLEGVR